MDPLRFEGKRYATPEQRTRAKAQDAADQFEQMFVRTLVSSLRSTASLAGEEGGMFGKGPGSQTYGDWFDQNLAEQIGRDSDVGIASSVMRDWERHEQLPIDEAQRHAKQQADRSYRTATTAKGMGGIDAVL